MPTSPIRASGRKQATRQVSQLIRNAGQRVRSIIDYFRSRGQRGGGSSGG